MNDREMQRVLKENLARAAEPRHVPPEGSPMSLAEERRPRAVLKFDCVANEQLFVQLTAPDQLKGRYHTSGVAVHDMLAGTAVELHEGVWWPQNARSGT